MANSVIQLKYSNVTGNVPVTLANGEIAINTYDGKIFYRGGPSNTILSIQGSSQPSGLNQEVQFNDNGTLGANADFTYDKITGTLEAPILLANSYIQFRDGTRQYTANAGSGGTGTSAAIDRQTYTATAAQTTFAIKYSSPYVLVLINGAAIDPTEYTATNNTSITLVSSTQAGDIVDLIGFAGNVVTVAIDQTARNTANAAFDKANTGTSSLDQVARDTANASFLVANTASDRSLSAGIYANGAFNASNSTSTYANTAFQAANTSDVKATSAGIYANGSFSAANSASIYANGAFAVANTANNRGLLGGIYANGAFEVANSASIYANGAFALANISVGVDLTQNTNITNAGNYANGAFALANLSANVNLTQNTNITNTGNYANGAFTVANTANDRSLSAGIYANGAFALANAGVGVDTTQNTNITNSGNYANGAFAAANTASIYANGAFTSSNSRLSLTGGVLTGSLNISSGSLNVSSNIYVGGFIDLNTRSSNPPRQEGRLFYDNTQKSLTYYNEGTVTLQIGQENIIRVYNGSGTTILNGRAVYIVPGASANGFANVALANSALQKTSEVIGIATENIANGAYGYVTNLGKVNGLDTSLYQEGQELYLSDTVPGTYTNTPPNPPSIPINIGYTTISDPIIGQIYVLIHLMEGINKTTGSILFARNKAIDEDPEHLFWDYQNNRLGINTGNPTANLHVAGDGLFTGNLTISGNLFITNAQSIVTKTLDVGGNLIILNSNTVGTPVSNAEIRVNRGNQANAFLRWDESILEWVTYDGAGQVGHIITSEKTMPTWDDYSTRETYEKLKYPIGADLANATNETAKTADARSIVAENLAISSFLQANAAFATANSASTYANGAFNAANTANSNAISAGIYANAAFQKANTGGASIDQTARDTANAAFIAANSAGSYANSAFLASNNQIGVDLTQNTSIAAAFAAANTASIYANGAFVAANSDGFYANAAFIAANAASLYANSAYTRANNSLNANTGGVVSGTLNVSSNIITSNLTVTSNATSNLGAIKLIGFPSGTNLDTGLLQIGRPLGFVDTDIIVSATHNVNSYAQMILQNQNSGSRASADFIVNNDRPGGTAIYGDFGINSSTFSGASPFNQPDGVYLYGAGASLTIGTSGADDFEIATGDTLRANVNGTTGKMHVLGDAEIGGNFNVKGTSPGKIRTINFVIDGGGSVITAGPKGNVFVDFAGTIDAWTILGDTTGNVTVDISKSTYSTFPTFTGSGGTSPSLSNQQKNQRVGVNWTGFTSITANDIIRFVVSGTPANVTSVTVALDITSTT